MKKSIAAVIIAASFLGACSQQKSVSPQYYEIMNYKAHYNMPLQGAINELANKMDVESVVWSERLTPWRYKLIDTKVIPTAEHSDEGKEKAFNDLFKESALNFIYDSKSNEIRVEPTYQKEVLGNVKNKYELSKGETLKEAIERILKKAGHESVVWSELDEAQREKLNETLKYNRTIIERSGEMAVSSELEAISKLTSNPVSIIDKSSQKTLAMGGTKDEPEEVGFFEVQKLPLQIIIKQIANVYDVKLNYNAENYYSESSERTVLLSNNIEASLSRIFKDYNLKIEFNGKLNELNVSDI